MKIEWTRCAEKMPPATQIIVQYMQDKPELFDGSRINEQLAKLFPQLMRDTKWTRYTPETWEELNK